MNPEHRQLFNANQELKLKSTLFRLHFIYNFWSQLNEKNENTPLIVLFKKYIDDPDHIIRQLNSCECCVRHSKNRPLSLTELGDYNSCSSPWDTRPGEFIQMSQKKCKCYCRGYSRRIFDAFDEKNAYLIHPIQPQEDTFWNMNG